MMKDAIGQELNIGDIVAYIGKATGNIRIGRIIRQCYDNNIDIVNIKIPLTILGYMPKNVIKIHDQYKMNFPEMFI